MITETPQFNNLLEAHAALQKKNIELETENARLREAANHFRDCRSCEVDENFRYCWIGKQHNDFLSSLDDRKAV